MERPEVRASDPISTEENKMESTIESLYQEYIKAVGSDEPTEPQDMGNVTIDGGIVDYVRQRMHCERVTPEVVRQAVAFEREMSRVQGW